MSEFTGTEISLAHLLLAMRYPFMLYIAGIAWYKRLPLQAALALAPQLQAAQANRTENVYETIIRPERAADALRGRFAPESLCHNLSEQQLLWSLSVLAHADVKSIEDQLRLQDALHAIRDRLGYAFFESAIRACVGKTEVSQDDTIRKCVRIICDYFPDDILSLAQRYGDLMIRLHGAKPFLAMLYYWCNRQAHVSREALVEAFDSPLTRAAAMILDHPNLSLIKSSKPVEAAFDALSLADRARLLLIWEFNHYNTHASSVERKLRLLGFDPSIQTTVRTSLIEDESGLLVRCLLHVPDPSSVHVVLEQARKQSGFVRFLLRRSTYKDLFSDEARMRLARMLISAPAMLHEVVVAIEEDDIRQLARSLPDASLGAALEAHLEWQKQIDNLSKQCATAVKNLIINHFGAQLEQLQDGADIAKVYDAMLQDHAWLSVVDETVANLLGAHSLMNTMYGISSEPGQALSFGQTQGNFQTIAH